MLVLTRKLQEKIQIGDNITISILRVKGNTVRIGIDAPREIRVIRAELARSREGVSSVDTEGVSSLKGSSQVPQLSASEDEVAKRPCGTDSAPLNVPALHSAVARVLAANVV